MPTLKIEFESIFEIDIDDVNDKCINDALETYHHQISKLPLHIEKINEESYILMR